MAPASTSRRTGDPAEQKINLVDHTPAAAPDINEYLCTSNGTQCVWICVCVLMCGRVCRWVCVCEREIETQRMIVPYSSQTHRTSLHSHHPRRNDKYLGCSGRTHTGTLRHCSCELSRQN